MRRRREINSGDFSDKKVEMAGEIVKSKKQSFEQREKEELEEL